MNVRLRVCVYNDQQVRLVTQAESYEPLLLAGAGILFGQGEGVFQDCDRLRKAHAVGA